ncbi:MAG: hypothetical protein KIT34_00535 [Cyanobacteria bacterium TGS_CYA1]|nr:hypothetical protein [Cyanobacteria bacterium TGS_CYA1]
MTQTLPSTAKESATIWQNQAWLASAKWDSLFIIAPAFITSILVICFRPFFENSSNLPLWAWVVLVMMVDVAHVYATLFRTYLDKRAFQRNKSLLIAIPLACWAVGALLYSVSKGGDGNLFWRTLAYLAVFHFIRQQYGFMALYSRKDSEPARKFRLLDGCTLYLATIYPVLYWHTHLPRNFNWFVAGDFATSLPEIASQAAFCIYAAVAGCYVLKEIWLYSQTKFFNIPRNLLIAGTALSWWVGIISINSDMAFTLTNVVSHGIPYMALIWLYHGATSAKKDANQKPSLVGQIFLSYVPAFVMFLVLLAFLEEGLWDGFIWREHLAFFGPFGALPAINDPAILSILIPFLALPQSTHYVLDGFIWRVKERDNVWSA